MKGCRVTGKVWIHYAIGDIMGNNRWAGHYQHQHIQAAGLHTYVPQTGLDLERLRLVECILLDDSTL